MYHSFEFSPSFSGATDVSGDVVWDDLEGLRAHGSNGLFNAWTIGFVGNSMPSGYMGPQATGAGDPNVEQVLFSLWDGGTFGNPDWKPALPLLPECDAEANPGQACCKRNCQDCAVHVGPVADDGSTGTQCRVYIPAYTGQRLRTRVHRVTQATRMSAYGRDWVGDEYEVSIQDVTTGQSWIVGRQLIAGGLGGLSRIGAFYEHIGCTACDAFTAKATRAGPWVAEPNGVRLMSARSRNVRARPEFTCHKHVVGSDAVGTSFFQSGPTVPDAAGDGTWDRLLYTCPVDGCQAPATPPSPPMAPPKPPPASPPIEYKPWVASTVGELFKVPTESDDGFTQRCLQVCLAAENACIGFTVTICGAAASSCCQFSDVERNAATEQRFFLTTDKTFVRRQLAAAQSALANPVPVVEASQSSVSVGVVLNPWDDSYGDDGGNGTRSSAPTYVGVRVETKANFLSDWQALSIALLALMLGGLLGTGGTLCWLKPRTAAPVAPPPPAPVSAVGVAVELAKQQPKPPPGASPGMIGLVRRLSGSRAAVNPDPKQPSEREEPWLPVLVSGSV